MSNSRAMLLASIIGATSLVEHPTPAMEQIRNKSHRELRRHLNESKRRNNFNRKSRAAEAFAEIEA